MIVVADTSPINYLLLTEAIEAIGDTIPIPHPEQSHPPHPRCYPIPVQFSLDIPEAFAAQLIAAGKDPAREALEALAVEGYRTHQLNESEIRRVRRLDSRIEAPLDKPHPQNTPIHRP